MDNIRTFALDSEAKTAEEMGIVDASGSAELNVDGELLPF